MQLDTARPAVRGVRLPRISVTPVAVARLAMAATGAVAFIVYLATLAPTVMWYDMGEFATTSATLGIAHNTGYPLLILTGKLFTFLPAGDVAYRVNLLSAVFTSLAVVVTFSVIHDLTDDPLAAAVGALTLAFASTVWANATWATSYGMNLFFTALVTRFMLAWWRERTTAALAGAALAFGLGMCNHRLIALTAPPSIMLLALGWRSLSPRALGIGVLALIAGLSVYLYLPIRGEQEPALSWARPANFHTYWSMFVNGQTPSDYWHFDLADRIGVLWSYPSYDLTLGGLALAALGAIVCASRHAAAAAYLVLTLALDALIVEAYSIHNIYNYLTPGYFALCVFIGVAGAWLIEAVRNLASAGNVRPGVRALAAAGVLALLPGTLLARNYQRLDRSGDYAASDFAHTTLERMPPDAVIMTDTWTASPLWYAQFVEGQRRDVIVSPIFSVPGEDASDFARRQEAAGRPVYVADGLRAPLDDLRRDFTLQPVLLDGIEQMVTNVLPRPEFRDALVMTGSLYRLRDAPQDSTVPSVPETAARNVDFPSGVTLAGFEAASGDAQRGDVMELSYYWRAGARQTHDLRCVTLFFDDSGAVRNVMGFPVWTQSRDIGAGALTTSRWEPGRIYHESYYTLVPRTLAPGRYDVRIAVFDPKGDPARTSADAHNLMSVGAIMVR